MKCQNKIKIILSIGILAVAMFAGGCQSQGDGTEGTEVVTRSPTRSDLIKEGKIKVKEKTETEETEEENTPEAIPSSETDAAAAPDVGVQQQDVKHYILNTNTRLFHDPSCEKVSYIAPHNYAEFDGTAAELLGQGYSACYTCQRSEAADTPVAVDTDAQQQNVGHYILNTNTRLFHNPSCEKVSYIAPHNYAEFDGTRDELIGQGYSACYTCDP